MKLPIKKPKPTKKIAQAWVNEDDLNLLKENEIKISELIQNSIKRAAAQVRRELSLVE